MPEHQPEVCEYVYLAIEEHRTPEDGDDTYIVGVFRTEEKAQAALDARGPAHERPAPGGGYIDRFIDEIEIDNPRQ